MAGGVAGRQRVGPLGSSRIRRAGAWRMSKSCVEDEQKLCFGPSDLACICTEEDRGADRPTPPPPRRSLSFATQPSSPTRATSTLMLRHTCRLLLGMTLTMPHHTIAASSGHSSPVVLPRRTPSSCGTPSTLD